MKSKKSNKVFLNKERLLEQIEDYLKYEYAVIDFLVYIQGEINLSELYQDSIPNTFKKFIKMNIVGINEPTLEIYQYDFINKFWKNILSDKYLSRNNPFDTFINNFDFSHTLIHVDNFGYFLDRHQRVLNLDQIPPSCRCIFSIKYEDADDEVFVEKPVKWGDYSHFYLSDTKYSKFNK